MRLSRGAALVETAFTMSVTMMLIFGVLQLAVIGFFQMQLDGATFFFAHSYATGSTNQSTLAAALRPLFPNAPVSMTPTIAAPPTTTMPVNWTQWGALNNRYGGASIARPQQVQTSSSLTVSGFSVLGNSINLSSGNVDGRMMIGNHDDDAQGVDFNSATANSTLVDPLSQDDQNVPPYYFNLAFIWYCPDRSFSATCASSHRYLNALGLAEYLKDDNYTATANGIDTNGTFATIACHQRIYAELAAAFPASYASTQPYASGGNYDETSTGPSSVAAFGGASFSLVYSWDRHPIVGETGAGIGRMYPLNPTAGCGAGGPGA
ncbi:MAG: pilus assembly protein [Candidatus Eremiobacteraeota bacterium]|nr:pilus assembly protein [Candidatus Eremiobacteraeota bacterium]